MATYAIGDVQGCYQSLRALLARIGYDRGRDRLWFVGDLVNRGPGSLETLRFVSGLGERGRTVLGNHDLHLLGCAAGSRRLKAGDTLGAIVDAPDRAALIDWLRRQPLLFEADGWVVVHAGIMPGWTLETARTRAREVEGALRGDGWREALARWAQKRPSAAAVQRARQTLAGFTRMRCVDADGRPVLGYKGPPVAERVDLRPWYAARPLLPEGRRWLFGHWAAHGFGQVSGGYALDSGCLWGGSLTALRLDDEAVFRVPQAPGDGPSDSV